MGREEEGRWSVGRRVWGGGGELQPFNPLAQGTKGFLLLSGGFLALSNSVTYEVS